MKHAGKCTVAVAFGALLLLGSCGGPPYVEPSGPDRADATFTNGAPGLFFVNIYADAKDCTYRKNLVNDVPPGADRSIGIPANRYVALTVFEGVGTSSCTPTFDFYPISGRHYRIRLWLNKDECEVSVTDVRGASESPVHINKREYSSPLVETSSACSADTVDRSKPPPDGP
jgi:hypothetical protein